jgi:ethanolamine utilization protein
VIVSDELVTTITNEILRRLNLPSGVKNPGLQTASQEKKPLLTVGPLDVLSESNLASIKKRYEIYTIDAWEASGLPCAPLLMTSLGLQALCRVACGDEGCTVEGRALLSALLEGRTAVVLNSGIVWHNYKNTAPKTLLAAYQAHEAALKNAGVKFVSQDDILAALEGPKVPAWSPCLSPNYQAVCPATVKAGQVYTESKVQQLFPPDSGPGQFKLHPGDILTPLAKDYLLGQKITIAK